MSSLQAIDDTLRRIENLGLRSEQGGSLVAQILDGLFVLAGKAETRLVLIDNTLNRIGTALERIEASLLRKEFDYLKFPPTLFGEVQ